MEFFICFEHYGVAAFLRFCRVFSLHGDGGFWLVVGEATGDDFDAVGVLRLVDSPCQWVFYVYAILFQT